MRERVCEREREGERVTGSDMTRGPPTSTSFSLPRERVRVSERAKEPGGEERERVCVCERERGREECERDRESARERKIESVCECVC